MKVAVFALVLICLGCAWSCAGSLPLDSSSRNEIQKFSRRYAESTIASDISKIVDSMVQKNFVNFLLNQREKKSEPTIEDPDTRIFNDLLKKEFVMWVQRKGDAFKNQ
ncbi:gastric inhibitory polypeptide [Sinocyclocheilus anshuiensis]|uniref:Gastric inhibitory polypeptide-like n=1 Tax=Sinocyclocheilus anshuiensis TaxID=1608454 RepID=A0A671P4X7_9TELE|nr:PREDICTED: gastric inhibitory polypeptide-like [Sinocyclocheilus anshuiensis]